MPVAREQDRAKPPAMGTRGLSAGAAGSTGRRARGFERAADPRRVRINPKAALGQVMNHTGSFDM